MGTKLMFSTCPAPVLNLYKIGIQVSLWNQQSFYLLSVWGRSDISDSDSKGCLQTEISQSHNIINLLLHLSSDNFACLVLTESHCTDSLKPVTCCSLGKSCQVSTFRAKWKRWSIIWRVQVKCQLSSESSFESKSHSISKKAFSWFILLHFLNS